MERNKDFHRLIMLKIDLVWNLMLSINIQNYLQMNTKYNYKRNRIINGESSGVVIIK